MLFNFNPIPTGSSRDFFQKFDPIPLFNLVKHKDPKIRKHAEETLFLMFERIPLKNEIDLNNWKFKNSLFDERNLKILYLMELVMIIRIQEKFVKES